MNKLSKLLLAAIMGGALLTTPISAFAMKNKDYPNSGFCKSGKHVKNVKKCKENGGRK